MVKPVASPIARHWWEIHETSLMMRACDRGAQGSFFRTAEFDSFGDTQFWPTYNSFGLYDLMRGILDAAQAD